MRSRGGSKSHDLVALGLYLAYRGYDGVYFCATADQCVQPAKYLNDLVSGSFLARFVRSPPSRHLNKRSATFANGGRLRVKNLTESKARSSRGDFVFFDEEREMEAGLLRAASSILNTSELALTVHASTPAKGSTFEDSYRRVRELEGRYGQPLVFERSWRDIGFLQTEKMRALIELRRERWPRWYFRMEYENQFTVPEGAVFRDVVYEVPREKYHQFDRVPGGLVSGLDFNPAAGHTLVALKWSLDHGEALVAEHRVLGTGYAKDLRGEFWRAIQPYCTGGNLLIMEDGGINIPFVEKVEELQHRHRGRHEILKEEWDNRNIAKMNAAMRLRSKRLWLDESQFPSLARQVQNAAWEVGPDGEPALAKDPSNSPHGLDALLHAASPRGSPEGGANFKLGGF
jgi:hypothetical protein